MLIAFLLVEGFVTIICRLPAEPIINMMLTEQQSAALGIILFAGLPGTAYRRCVPVGIHIDLYASAAER